MRRWAGAAALQRAGLASGDAGRGLVCSGGALGAQSGVGRPHRGGEGGAGYLTEKPARVLRGGSQRRPVIKGFLV